MLRVGDKVAGYEIVAPLKAGGMAALYLGRRSGAAGFAKHVAIKVVHSHLAADQSFVEMFLDEARLSARIEHPNCVHVHDLGESEGMYFLVMEYVQGCALSQFMTTLAEKDLKLSVPMSVFVASGVAAGLHAAHELTDDQGEGLGVVHRDVSPQNVLVAYKGHVKLIDFGIAKARGRMQQTAAGLLKGKFRYMAPEQAMGRPVDRRTDVYALGVVLWEMLTMRKLFDADNELALLDMVRNPTVPKPSSIAADVPPALDQVVLGALAPDPNNRFASCMQFRKALQQAVPESLGIDAPQLCNLITTVMADVIADESNALPESAVGTAAKLAKQDLAAVSEYTVSLPGMLAPPITPPQVNLEDDRGRETHDESTGELSISDAIPMEVPKDGTGAGGNYPATVMLDDFTPPPEAKAAAEALGLGQPAATPAPGFAPGANQASGPGAVHQPVPVAPAESKGKGLVGALIGVVVLLILIVVGLVVWQPWATDDGPVPTTPDAAVVTPTVPDAEVVVEVPDADLPDADVPEVDEDPVPVVNEVREPSGDRPRNQGRRPNGQDRRSDSRMTQDTPAMGMGMSGSRTVDMTRIITGDVF